MRRSDSASLRDDGKNVARGLLMGGADIIPGVSGGTVALILGIYDRLVGALARFDTTFVGCLRRGHLADAARHIDLRFLAALGSGIAIGILGLASTMHWLLTEHQSRTLAAFFGMIVASSLLVGRMVDGWGLGTIVAALLGTGFAFWLVGLPFVESPPQGLPYVLMCGVVAICAMILPGISGAFILLILGKYHEITGTLRGFLHGQVTADGVATVVVFACGAAAGLLGFSRVLRWLLARYHTTTMAVLAGFMIGSLRKIWPFKVDATPEILEFGMKRFENTSADLADPNTWVTIAIGIGAGVFVLVLDFVANRGRRLTPATTPAADDA